MSKKKPANEQVATEPIDGAGVPFGGEDGVAHLEALPGVSIDIDTTMTLIHELACLPTTILNVMSKLNNYALGSVTLGGFDVEQIQELQKRAKEAGLG